jgi:nucleoid-associated protein YgaU
MGDGVSRVSRLRLICAYPKVDIRVQMGEGPAQPTAGAANHEVTQRLPGRRSITTRTSPPPFQQDVPVFLDGLAERRSVQRQVDAILSLGSPDALPFRAHGPIHRSGELFVFGGEPDFGEAIRDDDEDETLIRQRLTLKLMRWTRPDPIKEHRDRRRRKRQGPITDAVAVSYTTRKGDTLAKIAARLLRDWRRWKEIGQKNGISDPYRKLPEGRELIL